MRGTVPRGPTAPRGSRKWRVRARALAICVWGACAAAVARPVGADELLLVTGDRITGIVLKEGAAGVWVEVAAGVAVYYAYDDVARARKWAPARNAALFTRPATPPLPPAGHRGEIVLRTDDGVWFLVKPRMARFVTHAQFAKLRAAPQPELTPGNRRRAALERLYEQPEPLTRAQLTHRLGPPTRRLRREGRLRWVYELEDKERAVLHFRDGVLDYVEFLAE